MRGESGIFRDLGLRLLLRGNATGKSFTEENSLARDVQLARLHAIRRACGARWHGFAPTGH